LGHTGKVYASVQDPEVTIDGTKLTVLTMSMDPKAVNVLLDQTISITAQGTTYSADASVTIKRSWVPLTVSTASSEITRLPDGNYLVTSVMVIDPVVDAGTIVPVSRGLDLSQAPASIITRLILDSSKTKVLAQAIDVVAKGAK
jgi:hypothetical protein